MKGAVRHVAALAIAGLTVGAALATAVMAAAAAANYPGGASMVGLHRYEAPSLPLSVHIGNLAATTGVSRFLEANRTWQYSKEEGLQPDDLALRRFDRLLTELHSVPGYACLGVVHGFERVAIQRPPRFPVQVMRIPKVYVLARSLDGVTVPCDGKAPLWG
eukprot:UN0610